MPREAFISNGVAYHHGLVQPGKPLAHFEVLDLGPEQVGWHSHGAYEAYPEADVLVHDGQGCVMLFLDERSYVGKLLVGTMDPDCHAGFGTETTRPLLRAILAWVRDLKQAQVGAF